MSAVEILRVDGRRETHEVPRAMLFEGVYELIGCTTIDTVNLRDGRIMLVDDDGYETEIVDHGMAPPPENMRAAFGDKPVHHIERRCVRAKKPVNPQATALYHGVCDPGTTHQIVGDVAIVADADFIDPVFDSEHDEP